MGFRRVAVIMAGGSGTRFWPVSTDLRPKQFLSLAPQQASLIEQSAARIAPMVGGDLFVATSASLLSVTRAALPQVTESHIFDEPSRRNTLGALVWTTARLIALFEEDWRNVSVAILTADHLIKPDDAFRSTAEKALTLAEESGALVTIGVRPTRPATEYGYIEVGEPLTDGAWSARRFTEKPDASVASSMLDSGGFLWNSGMFFWTLESFRRELAQAQPESSAVLDDLVASLRAGDESKAIDRFGDLTSVSIDYALMERASKVAVLQAGFDWDDLGSWDALSRSLPPDERGNVSRGRARFVDSADSIVYNDTDALEVSVLGLEGVVVVVTDGQVLVCHRSRAQDVRRLAD